VVCSSVVSSWSGRKVPGRKSSASFLIPAAGLILLGTIQQPLYQIMVKVDTVPITTCADVPSYQLSARRNDDCRRSLLKPIGIDIEPAQMALVQHLTIRSRMASELASTSIAETQANLWSVNATVEIGNGYQEFDSEKKLLRYWVFRPHYSSGTTPGFFAAGLPVDTTTGVLREHLMRLNSSIKCDEIEPSVFPSPCPGDGPFQISWGGVINTDVKVCVPGNYAAFPWTLSRNRQDLLEEIYIDIKDNLVPSRGDAISADPSFNTSSTIRCTASTTRGDFELGNTWNNNTYGPLLEEWPSSTQMAEDFNDWTHVSGSSKDAPSYVPSEV
jgi:hypothetical protein